MYSLMGLNWMEQEMHRYLDWELMVDNPILSNFKMMVQRDFHGMGPRMPKPTTAVSLFFPCSAVLYTE
jgi:hypothetical protein